jgi:hypothetical protein
MFKEYQYYKFQSLRKLTILNTDEYFLKDYFYDSSTTCLSHFAYKTTIPVSEVVFTAFLSHLSKRSGGSLEKLTLDFVN